MMRTLLHLNIVRPSGSWSGKMILGVFALLFTTALQAQPLSGSYTVCGSGSCDYSTIGAAVSALTTNGVSGPVTVNIAAGTYNEYVNITAISGVSATNTVTFKGAGPNSTIINQTSSAHGIRIYYSNYIQVEDLKINHSTSSTGYGAYVYYSNNTRFDNVNINVSGSGTKYGLYVYFSNDGTYSDSKVILPHYGVGTSSTNYTLYNYYTNNNKYQDNLFEGGYYGAYVYGSSSYAYGNNIFEGNRIKGTAYYPIYSWYNYSNTWDGNIIDTNSINVPYHYGMYSYYEGNLTLKNNIFRNGYYGIMMYYPNQYSTKSTDLNLIYNNMFILNETNSYYGMYLYAYNSVDVKLRVYHNTIYKSTNSGYGIYLNNTQGYNIHIKNNLVNLPNGGQMAYYYDGVDADIDGNAYYNNNGAFGYYNGATYSSFADYKKAAAGNGDAVYDSEMNASFKSTSHPHDLHLDQFSPAPSGVGVGVTEDFDGDPRCLIFPTSGADENNFGKGPFKAKFFVPSIVYNGSPVVFYNFAKLEEPKVHRWYVDGVLVSDSVHLATALTGTSHVVSLVSIGCGGTDSTWQTVTVTTPPVVPASDFVASQNSFLQGGRAAFTDISSYGPLKWKWEVKPATVVSNGAVVASHKFVEGTTDSSQMPVIEFPHAGKYEICLTSTNAKGQGNTECKLNYITAIPAINFSGSAGFTSVREESGYVFDDGGPDNNYASTGNIRYVYMLLDPCASEVFLMVNKFELECGWDYLRIWDGADTATGIPLHEARGCTANMGNDNRGPGFSGGALSCSNPAYACKPSPTDTFVAKSGKMLLEFYVDHGTDESGFELFYWSTPKVSQPPVASFTVDTSVCQNGLLTFKNTSTGDDNNYYWEFDNDFSTIESEEDDEALWLFTIPGKQTVTLIAENCGGFDTFQQVIDVFVPNKPVIDFEANTTNPTTTNVVTITPDISECVDEYKWTFTHTAGSGQVKYVNGTSQFSLAPQVILDQIGCWDVTLEAINAGGTSTFKKTCYINVKDDYCTPSVATLIGDVGISEVNIIAADTVTPILTSATEQSKKDYNNYVNDPNKAGNLEIGVTYFLQVKRSSSANAITRTMWIDWNLDGDFDDPQEKVAEETNTSAKDFVTTFTVPIIAKTGATVMRVAANAGQYSNAVCGQNRFGEYEDYRLYVTDDQTPPVITLFGPDGSTAVPNADTIFIEQGRSFSEWGFDAVDNLSGNVTHLVTADTLVLPNGITNEPLNTFVVREYRIAYEVTDAAGNKSEPTSRIIVILPDTTEPELKVGGTDTIRHNVDDAANFQMPQVISVNDIVDGIQVNMKTEIYNDGVIVPVVDPAVVDTYTVVFSATDNNNNTKEVVRVIIIEDKTNPTLNLVGANPVDHPVHTPYTDAGVTIGDNYWPSPRLDEGLSSSTDLNVDVIGTYTYTYTLTDPSGNGPVTAVRTINVGDKIAPVATVDAEDTIVVEVMTKFTFPKVSYSDNYFKNAELGTEWQGTLMPTINTEGILTKLGIFTLRFVVDDPSGNVTTVERIVRVGDFTAPEIELAGEEAITLCRWEDYVDAGYIVSDNYWPNSTITIDTAGTFYPKGPDVEGLYTVRYVATDSSGNVSQTKSRNILVLPHTDVTCANGIEDANDFGKYISVYPNPSTGSFNVKIAMEAQEQLRISVMNMLGEELMIVKDGLVLSEVLNVDLSAQASGVYFLKVQSGDFSHTTRLVISK